MRTLIIFLFLALTGTCFSAEAFKPVPFTNVKIEDTFWKSRLETNQKVSIPHNYKWCEETGRFDNFAKAAGLLEGEFRGIYFNDSDVYKVLEGTAYSLASNPDPELEKAADKVIDWIAAAQLPNGYINSYYQLKEPDKKWTNTRVMHELYCLGHMFEAAVAYKQATGKTKLLEVAEKAADHVADTFGYEEGKKREVPGHEEIELALVKMYDLTGKEKYLNLSKMFIDLRGDQSKRTDKLQGHYSQDHKPVREQDEVVGHSVRAMYLYCGMTDIAAKTGDEQLIQALDKLWDSVVRKKMYITGGIGARHEGEAFGEDYELPNRTAYCETCAAIGLVFWAHRMNLLHGNAMYADVVERALYNGVLSGIGRSGKSFFYVNPLESTGNHHRQPFFDCACCPTNVIRLIPSIPGYQYAVDEEGIIINQFISGKATINHPTKGKIDVEMKTDYPFGGNVQLSFPGLKQEIRFKLRIPDQYRSFSMDRLQLSPGMLETMTSDGRGYLWFTATPKRSDFTVGFRIEPQRMVSDPRVVANKGRVAIQRGPLVYCFEQCDNEVPISQILLADTPCFREEFQKDLLGGIVVLKCKNADGRELTAIPYYAWDHREPGPMAVWVRQEGLSKNRADNWGDTLSLYDELQREQHRQGMFTGDAEPLTIYETTLVTASHCWGNDSPDAAFDDLEPKNSNDHTIPRLTWWDHKGTDEWVTLSFEKPQTFSQACVYWFDDAPQGECRLPESWSLSYKNGGDWVPIKSTFEVKKDAYCTAKFDEITALEIRVNVKLQENFSGGILEIKLDKWIPETQTKTTSMNPILYLGDDDISSAAIYLAGVLSHFGIPFERVDSNQSPGPEFFTKQYSLYILSDYPRKQFQAGQLEHLVQAVRQGSGLLMVGGWGSFYGKDGEYHDSPLVEVLPVKMSDCDDRRNSFQPLVVRKLQEHEVLDPLPWEEAPPTFGGYNAITPKPDATVLLDAVRLNVQYQRDSRKMQVSEGEAIPLLIVGTFGKGKTAALATDVAPHWVGGFVDWGDQRITQTVGDGFIEVGNHYARFLRNLVLFLRE